MVKISAIRPQQTRRLCQQYWDRVLQDSKPLTASAVTDHNLLSEVNFMLLRRNHKGSIISKFTAEKIIKKSDKEFKLLKPLEEALTLWRGVSQPRWREEKFVDEFIHSYNVKPGDIIHMKEYAFASKMKSGAEVYTKSNYRSILYEIEVPKGSRISYSFNYVFPRYSKFECVDVNEVRSESGIKKIIKLKYINEQK